MLLGRDAERAAIEALIAGARAGRSGVLVVRGEAGIGKTALLDEAAAVAEDFRVLRGTGVEFESALPFSGLHLLLRGTTGEIADLPAGQAHALRAALGLGPAPTVGEDRFLVGLAVLSLLAELAEGRPLLCIVDDAHWLDQPSAEALLFAARRLQAERIAIVFAVRDGQAPAFRAPGLAQQVLSRLEGGQAADLLNLYAADLPHHTRTHILAEAEGNPLALLELSAAAREGRTVSSYAAGPAQGRIQQAFADRIESLPQAARTLLLVAAADDTGEAAVVLRAAAILDAGIEDLEPAERHGLIGLDGDRLVFHHPLVRSAAYQGAPAARRLGAHRALAETSDADRSAWHLAAATTEPDEKVAAALEDSAEQAQRRGGQAALAAAYERASALSPDAGPRGRRLRMAAQSALDAGQLDRAGALAEAARRHTSDPMELAATAEVAALAADEQGDRQRAHSLLMDAALSIAEVSPDSAGRMLFQAAASASVVRDAAGAELAAAHAERLGLSDAHRVRALSRLSSPDVADRTAALRELYEGVGPDLLSLRGAIRAARWVHDLRDHRQALEHGLCIERECRAQGAVGLLPHALVLVSLGLLNLGRHRDALAGATEGLRMAEDTGQARVQAQIAAVLCHLAAIAGDEARHAELAELIHAENQPGGLHELTSSLAELDLGLGRYQAAADRLSATAGQAVCSCTANEVEAALRAGRPEAAARAHARYADLARHLGQVGIDAIAARCTALLAGDDEAEPHYRHALDLHQQDGNPYKRARTELLYGEWLRRMQRPADARVALRSAHETFEHLGARPWATRAMAELRAAGETRTAPRHDAAVAGRLTPQELQVARLAATGLSNREIGAQLFLSPRTVGYHLYNAYPKLGVANRVELGRLDLSA
ncbi:AAA family ATPase [Streptomyces sp. NPDC002795]|uniref:helix-turn-helix transcriptional regulator n=1 Tax=Streptomyces sp. NPDC002795 TaxID=3364665 RepID=UPI0036BD7217